MAIEMPDPIGGAIAAASFVATEVDNNGNAVYGHPQGDPVTPGESFGSGFIGGKLGLALALQAGEEERKSLERLGVSTSVARQHVTQLREWPSSAHTCNKLVRVADGKYLPIEGHGNLTDEFQSGRNSVHLKCVDVAYVPSLSYYLSSGLACVKQDHAYLGDHRGITVNRKSGESLLFPLVGTLYFSYGTRLDSETVKAFAFIDPGLLPTTDVDIIAYHRSTAHTHKRLLLRPAELIPCVRRLMAKGISAPVNKVINVVQAKN